jgi:hypothetical protein
MMGPLEYERGHPQRTPDAPIVDLVLLSFHAVHNKVTPSAVSVITSTHNAALIGELLAGFQGRF